MRYKIDISSRPEGISSRVHLSTKKTRAWHAPNGVKVPLPLIVDHLNKGPNGEVISLVEAEVVLTKIGPKLKSVWVTGKSHLDPNYLQNFFRWATPVDIVCSTIPRLIANHIDPFTYEYATTGYPDSAHLYTSPREKLSDDFILEIYDQYLKVGHGYAQKISAVYSVSPRTVVGWIEKGRKRGLIPATKQGKKGQKL